MGANKFLKTKTKTLTLTEKSSSIPPPPHKYFYGEMGSRIMEPIKTNRNA